MEHEKSAYEKYFYAVQVMLSRQMTDDEILDVTISMIDSFRQGTGLGGGEIYEIISLARDATILGYKAVRVDRAKGLRSGEHAPKWAIVDKYFLHETGAIVYTSDHPCIVPNNSEYGVDEIGEILSIGNTVQEAWQNLRKGK